MILNHLILIGKLHICNTVINACLLDWLIDKTCTMATLCNIFEDPDKVSVNTCTSPGIHRRPILSDVNFQFRGRGGLERLRHLESLVNWPGRICSKERELNKVVNKPGQNTDFNLYRLLQPLPPPAGHLEPPLICEFSASCDNCTQPH